jgi:hypothetical protein
MRKNLLFLLTLFLAGTAFAQKPATQTNKTTIKDCFNMFVPEFARKNTQIVVEDIPNGYMRYKDPETFGKTAGETEITMWKWLNGKPLMGVNFTNCQPDAQKPCGLKSRSFPELYYFEAGEWQKEDMASAYLPMDEILQAYEKFDKLIVEDQKKPAQISPQNGKITVQNRQRWCLLPQKGKTIKLGYLLNQNTRAEKFYPILELSPNAKNDDFVVSKKYELSSFK